jgi:hypothetical protein
VACVLWVGDYEKRVLGERRYPGLEFEIDTIAGFSAYLMSSHGNGGCFLGYTDKTKKVAIQAQHSVTKIGENEGGSGAFVCDFVVEDLRAAMQALNDFRGMVVDDESDDDDEDDEDKDGDDDDGDDDDDE